MSESCYIYWDEENLHMQCTECYAKNGKGTLWSSEYGYGPYKITCICGKVIHNEEEGEDDITRAI